MADEDYLKPARAFLDWFKAWPGTTFHNDIEIVDFRHRGAGRGIVAKKDIAADTVLFTIPRKAVICSATSDLASLIPSIRQGNNDKDGGDDNDADGEDNGPHDPWTSLILVMMYEFLRGDKSPWKPYLDVLPSEFGTPMFWTTDELKELQASPVLGRVGREEADSMIRTKVLPVIKEHSKIFFLDGVASLSEEELFTLAHRMGSTIMAYSFSLEKDSDDDDDDDEEGDEGDESGDDDNDGKSHDGDSSDGSGNEGWEEDKDDQLPLGMVPMADMLNADAEFNAHINHGIDSLTATAVRPIKAGEEILNYYGPLSNGELLRRYGYTTEKHEHFDAVDLPWELVQKSLTSQLGISSAEAGRVLEVLDPDELEDPVMLDRDFDEDEETGRLTAPESGCVLAELPSVLRRQARAFVKVARKRQDKAKKPNTKNRHGSKAKHAEDDVPKSEKAVVMAAIAEAIDARLAAYPTILDADLALLEKLQEEDKAATSGRLSCAVRVRIGEKRLLSAAASLAKEALNSEETKKDKNASRKDISEPSSTSKRQRTKK